MPGRIWPELSVKLTIWPPLATEVNALRMLPSAMTRFSRSSAFAARSKSSTVALVASAQPEGSIFTSSPSGSLVRTRREKGRFIARAPFGTAMRARHWPGAIGFVASLGAGVTRSTTPDMLSPSLNVMRTRLPGNASLETASKPSFCSAKRFRFCSIFSGSESRSRNAWRKVSKPCSAGPRCSAVACSPRAAIRSIA
jgi:hypothetical protein